ncbi:MAG TPA: efflux transporter outer membrane subunit, partial [Burkholderiales bacterium]|nr:efflux transporter outer membrane subunit [Burkholderiales bacterium]
YRQALADVGIARSALFPTVSANASASRSHYSALVPLSSPTQSISGSTRTIYDMSLDASWEPDLWGGIRRALEAGRAQAEASGKNLESVRLSTRATLAQDYFLLRVDDEEIAILERIAGNCRRYLDIIENQYRAGVVSSIDVETARSQLESAQSQAVDLGLFRAQEEHAIAVLLGKAPENFSIRPVKSSFDIPDIPGGIPSKLLERRPDIAQSERLVAAANAKIGVARAAFFPNLFISPSIGYQSTSFAYLTSVPMRTWSIGPAVAQTLFDAGLARSQTDSAIAAYDAAVAAYRQTVLSGFQEVEDNLSALDILAKESEMQKEEEASSGKILAATLNRYRAGMAGRLDVVTAKQNELAAEKATLDLAGRRMTASITLIKAIGGSW